MNQLQEDESILKKRLLSAIQQENVYDTRNLIRIILASKNNIEGNCFFISKFIENLALPQECKVAILSSFAVKSIIPYFKVAAYLHDFNVKLHFCSYGQYEQEIIDKNSEMYSFEPNVLILFLRLTDLMPTIFHFSNGSCSNIEQKLGDVLSQFEEFFSTINNNFSINKPLIIVHNFEYPPMSVREASNFSAVCNPKRMVDLINSELWKISSKYTNVNYFDYNYFNYLHGYKNVYDEVLLLMSQNPIISEKYLPLAEEYIRYLRRYYGKTYKCIAIDADNTLWGGTIGEDGIEGIEIGDEYPGAVYKNFQNLLLDYQKKGVLLILLSKNNEEDVLAVLKNHPKMVLREHHFVNIKANWEPKSSNLLECINDLNIGLDSVVFVDDSPFERELMRSELPSVNTIELPNRPELYKEVLLAAQILEKDNITEEDYQRNKLYFSEKRRKDAKKEAKTIEDFYMDLEMKVSIKQLDKMDLDRAASMTQRTNQFNLTTKRYSIQGLEELLENFEYKLFGLKLIDKFGDCGLVGLAIIKRELDKSLNIIDTFLLSCRVIGRTVEDVFMSYVIDNTRDETIKFLQGEYVRTSKNAQVKNFYQKFNMIKKNVIDLNLERTIWQGEYDELKQYNHPWFSMGTQVCSDFA